MYAVTPTPAQVIEGREDFDFSRHAVFCAFGFAYLGAFQYWLYNIKFTQWCGHITARVGHIGTAPVKVAIDQLLQYVAYACCDQHLNPCRPTHS